MPRLAGIDIPEKKKILYALQYIHGIGNKMASDLLKKCAIDPDRRASTLDDQELSSIASYIDETLVVEGALRRQTQQHIQRLKETKSYRGERHRKGLPVRARAARRPSPARRASRVNQG